MVMRVSVRAKGAGEMGKRRSNLLDTAEAAQELRLKKHTLENMRHLGNGPVFHKLGGRVFYHRADLKRWSQQCRRRSSSGERA
jgi:Helix-turn-helix domain